MERVDPREIEAKLFGFANKLLEEAQGDPVRALGLLVLVLEGLEHEEVGPYGQLLSEVRRVLIPQPELPAGTRAVQHLAGEMSWEGYQHCMRCGAVLVKSKDVHTDGFPSGYVYEIGGRLYVGSPEDYDACGI